MCGIRNKQLCCSSSFYSQQRAKEALLPYTCLLAFGLCILLTLHRHPRETCCSIFRAKFASFLKHEMPKAHSFWINYLHYIYKYHSVCSTDRNLSRFKFKLTLSNAFYTIYKPVYRISMHFNKKTWVHCKSPDEARCNYSPHTSICYAIPFFSDFFSAESNIGGPWSFNAGVSIFLTQYIW
jgi:hypothetical protein